MGFSDEGLPILLFVVILIFLFSFALWVRGQHRKETQERTQGSHIVVPVFPAFPPRPETETRDATNGVTNATKRMTYQNPFAFNPSDSLGDDGSQTGRKSVHIWNKFNRVSHKSYAWTRGNFGLHASCV